MNKLTLYDVYGNFIKEIEVKYMHSLPPDALKSHIGFVIWNTDKIKHWVKYGIHHRLDGPAVEYHDGAKEYWINGERILYVSSEESFKLYVDLLKLKGLL